MAMYRTVYVFLGTGWGEVVEKLLTIKEAASFLNVSEMSLRRWTNAGKLKCYRVGGKKERRFARQDIDSFLQGGQGHIPLGIGDLVVNDSAHIAHLYHRVEESLPEGLAYLGKGLSLGESILVISTRTRLAKILAGLADLGFPVAKLLDDGVITTDTGRRDRTEQLQFMTRVIASGNYPNGFRLLGDMTWAVEKAWSVSDINALENHTNHALLGRKNLFLCQYDLTLFGADAAMMALATHRHTAYRGELKESPYFVAPSSHS